MAACSGNSGKENVDVLEFGGDDDTSVSSADADTGQSDASPAFRGQMPGGSLAKIFNDSNYVHWRDASAIGIEPLTDLHSHWQPSRPLFLIEPCADFDIDTLTYSFPFMVKPGVRMVHEIGRRFRDTLAARGIAPNRVIITSVTRTPSTVRRLQRINRNAVDSSVHQLGTTVDIAYNKFRADDTTQYADPVEMKMALARVLYAMRAEGKIWVKYEVKQPCFHISARK